MDSDSVYRAIRKNRPASLDGQPRAAVPTGSLRRNHHGTNGSSGNLESYESSAGVARVRAVDVARLHSARPDHERDAESNDCGRWSARDDFESCNLRESDR